MIKVRMPGSAVTGAITVEVDGHIATWTNYTVTDPPYHIKFKADGLSKIFEACDPGYYSTPTCGEGAVPRFYLEGTNTHARISVCSPEGVTGAIIESWNGNTILFNGNFPLAYFKYFENDEEFSSSNADSQSGSELHINNITREEAANGRVVYKAEGTFNCNVARYAPGHVGSIFS
jgi:hypothetical protein